MVRYGFLSGRHRLDMVLTVAIVVLWVVTTLDLALDTYMWLQMLMESTRPRNIGVVPLVLPVVSATQVVGLILRISTARLFLTTAFRPNWPSIRVRSGRTPATTRLEVIPGVSSDLSGRLSDLSIILFVCSMLVRDLERILNTLNRCLIIRVLGPMLMVPSMSLMMWNI